MREKGKKKRKPGKFELEINDKKDDLPELTKEERDDANTSARATFEVMVQKSPSFAKQLTTGTRLASANRSPCPDAAPAIIPVLEQEEETKRRLAKKAYNWMIRCSMVTGQVAGIDCDDCEKVQMTVTPDECTTLSLDDLLGKFPRNPINPELGIRAQIQPVKHQVMYGYIQQENSPPDGEKLFQNVMTMQPETRANAVVKKRRIRTSPERRRSLVSSRPGSAATYDDALEGSSSSQPGSSKSYYF